jgi:hypothetical protein
MGGLERVKTFNGSSAGAALVRLASVPPSSDPSTWSHAPGSMRDANVS